MIAAATPSDEGRRSAARGGVILGAAMIMASAPSAAASLAGA
ncbi:hypothetical protein [Rubrimonas cliftonensis]|nr:hypothetical protein [Rubrimonas cliftonensis]